MASGDEGERLDPAPMAEVPTDERAPALASHAGEVGAVATTPDPIHLDVRASDALHEGAPERASFVARLAAMILDLLVLATTDAALVWTTSTAVLAAERLVGHPFEDAADVIGVLVAAGSVALVVGYFVLLHAHTGQTIGKSALKIRVRRTGGAPLGYARSALRFVGYAISALPFGLGFLGALASGRRALHDVLAGTVVERV